MSGHAHGARLLPRHGRKAIGTIMKTTAFQHTLVALLGLCLLAAPAIADDFAGAQKGIDAKLEASLEELAKVRARVDAEKLPLSRAVSSIEKQVLELRQKEASLRREFDQSSKRLTTLRKQADSLRDQEVFIDGRLKEFARDFESRIDISEIPRFEEITGAARLADKNANLDVVGKRETQLAVLDAALERLKEQLGGHVYEGEALSPDGLLTEGRFIALGPTVFFATGDGEVAGLVETQLNAADPVVAALPPEHTPGLVALASGQVGALPFDATLGKALKKEKAKKTLAQYVADGGAVGYVIIGLGAAALLLFAFKTFEITSFRVAQPDQVDRVLRELERGSMEGALKRAKEVRGLAGEMLATGVEHATEKRGAIEELLFEKILSVRPRLERFLPFLAITAAASPLLGLLGTVIGMIKTFQLITIFGTGDAKSLSSGISEALVTTALGLIVAIPTLIGHGALARMAKAKLGTLEQLSAAFVNGLVTIRHKSGEAAEKGADDD